MREASQIPLNQTQKLRLQRALQKLESLSSKANANTSVTVADSIPVNLEDGVLKGHGTSELNGEVLAIICGVVELVNKLVYVCGLRARYKLEVGDIVGHVIEYPNLVYLQSMRCIRYCCAEKRRRTAVDELNMCSIFVEDDVMCTEVRNFYNDGSLQLQARSQKYGKLEKGQLLTVPPYLVKRSKQHFHYLEQYGIDLIMGCNGFIWG